MIPILIKEYKIDEEIERKEEIIEFEIHEEKKKVKDIKELEKIADSIKYGAILVYMDISQQDIEKFSSINSKFGNIFLARIRNAFFIFGKEEELMESLSTYIGEFLEIIVNLNKEKLKSIGNDYRKISEKIREEKEKIKRGETPDMNKFEELANKNVDMLPFLKENEKRLELLKEFARNETPHGVFNSLLREIDEPKIHTLGTKIKIYSEYVNLLFQHYTMQLTEKGIKEIISLERALKCLYLFVGTYYITNLILLLIESWHGTEYHIEFPSMLLIIAGAFLFSYITLKFFKRFIKL